MALHNLTSAEIRKLKAKAQRLDPVVRVGKSGLSESVRREVDRALLGHQLIKVRFDQEREERDALARQIAEGSGAALIMQVGKVAVFFRAKPAPVNDAQA